MKTLFICLTDYQMLNALNIKMHLLKDKQADIIIFNNKEGLDSLCERLETSGIFSNVYFYTEKFDDLHKYFRNLSEKVEGVTLIDAIKNTIKNLYIRFLSNFESQEKNINRGIAKRKKIDFSKYDQVFGIETKFFVRRCIELIFNNRNGNCIINSIDEGLASYLSSCIKGIRHINNVYLYEPELAVYKNTFNSIIQIPKIDKNDKDFIEKVNFIFDFQRYNSIDFNNKILFFDQNWDAMPKYLGNISGIKKLLLNNLYKKHLNESFIYNKKMELFAILMKKSLPRKIFVKLHPRSSNYFISDYLEKGGELLPNIIAPWELFGCNYDIKNNIWITIHSSALCSYDFTIKSQKENKFIFLYKIILKNEENFEEIDGFFEQFRKKNIDRVFIPKDEVELMKCLERVL